MQSPGSAAPLPAGSFSGSTSTQESETLSNGGNAREPLELLEHGYSVVIRIDMKTLLDHVMNSLGSHREPIFSEIDCGDHGVKFSVALDVSGLRSVSGERISKSIVVGEADANRNTAESNAAWKAMTHLHEKHLIKLVDFSSRVAQKLDSYNTYDLFISGLRSVQKIFGVWEVTFAKFEACVVELENKQFKCNFAGDLSHDGVVFAVPADCLTSALNDLRIQTSNVRDQMDQLEHDLRTHEKKMTDKMKLSLRQGHYHTVELSSKEILEYLLTFLGLEDAKYRTSPGPDGHVRSFVKLKFPFCGIYQYSGPITIEGHGCTSVGANENAAFEALLFIEKQFPVKLVDWNFSLRKKSSKQQTALVVMVSKILEVGDKLKRMWLQLKNEIAGQHDLFRLDPIQLLSFGLVAAQIDAYKICARGLGEIDDHSSNSYENCAPDFQVLLNLSWQILAIKTKLHM